MQGVGAYYYITVRSPCSTFCCAQPLDIQVQGEFRYVRPSHLRVSLSRLHVDCFSDQGTELFGIDLVQRYCQTKVALNQLFWNCVAARAEGGCKYTLLRLDDDDAAAALGLRTFASEVKTLLQPCTPVGEPGFILLYPARQIALARESFQQRDGLEFCRASLIHG